MELQSPPLPGYPAPSPMSRQRGLVGVVVAVSLGLLMVLGALVIGTNNCRCLYRRLTKKPRGKKGEKQA